MEKPENPQKSRECKLKNLRVGALKKRTMKKTLLLIAAFCLIAYGATGQATQLEKGHLMGGISSTIALGGAYGSELMSLGFSTTSYKHDGTTEASYKTTVYNFLPKAGYFVIDNLAAGLEILISGYSEKDVDDGDTWKESTIGIGPFVRYYYPLEKIYPYAEAKTIFGSCKETWYDGDEEKSNLFMFGIYLGAAIPVVEHVTIDFSAGYSRASYKYTYDNEGTDEEEFEIHGGFGIGFGLTIYLPLK
jgi:outer membrane protein